MHLEKDRTYAVRLEYFNAAGGAEIRFGWGRVGLSDAEQALISAADAVIYAGGLNEQMEHEGGDRPWAAPPSQIDELNRVLALNSRVIAAINAGGNLNLGDADAKIPALLWCGYPGQNGNEALARILFGDLNPSGHLPVTFEKRFEDSPAFGNFPGDHANGGTVHLNEGVLVGYRWYDAKNIEPAFPFGFGLSYTTFAMKDLHVQSEGHGKARHITATVQVTNTGTRDGAEVVQLYCRPPQGALDRPPQELKAFARVELHAGETTTATLHLTRQDFATYDEASSSWKVPSGTYSIAVGASSRDIQATAPIRFP